jgi:hypothetical protein
MFDPDAHIPRPNRTLIYLGACVIAGLRLARVSQVNVRVTPTGKAIEDVGGPGPRDLQQGLPQGAPATAGEAGVASRL